MSTSHPPERLSSQLTDYVRVLRRHRLSIALLTILSLTAALGQSLARPKMYESRVRVLVRPTVLLSAQPNVEDLNMKTEQELAGSTAVAELAGKELKVSTQPHELLKRVSVEVAANTEILSISYRDDTPIRARAGARAFAESYLRFRHDQALNDLTTVSNDIQRRITRTNAQLSTLQTQAAAARNPAQRASIDAQIRSLQGQAAVLHQNAATLADPNDLLVGQIVGAPRLPESPASPKPIRDGALGVMMGLLLGVGLAFLRERTDGRLRGQDDLKSAAGGAVLAVIPYSQSLGKTKQMFVTIDEPDSSASEAYRALRSSFLRVAKRSGIKSVLVTSALPGDGKTLTAVNLAMSLAQAGHRVSVVSADLRRPMLSQVFDLPNLVGLSDVLMKRTRLDEAVRETRVNRNIKVLTSGSMPSEAIEQLDSDVMRQVLWTLAAGSDYLLIDTGPVLAVADAVRLSPLVDGILLVVGQGTEMDDVRHARQQLAMVEAVVLGTVLNKYEASKSESVEYLRHYSAYAQKANGNGSGKNGVSTKDAAGRTESDRT